MFRKKSALSESEVIQGLINNQIEQQRCENYLYDTYAYLVRLGMKKYRLTQDEGLDAYSDTIIAVIKNIQTQRFKQESSLKTYLTGIFFRKCIDLVRRKTTNQTETLPIEDFFNLGDTVKNALESLIMKEKVVAIMSDLQQLGEKCAKILEKWAMGYSDKEIAAVGSLQLKNAKTVKSTRHRCLQKLKGNK